MEEIWKDVVGYEQIYEVSNYGRVRTHKNKRSWSKRHNTWRYWKQRYLKDKTPNGRDFRVALWKDGKVKYYLAHRLVAFAFITNDDITKDCINHIDGNPKNNHVENLEWCSRLENNRHAFENELIQVSHKVVLVRTEDKKEFRFNSKAQASHFLGRNHGYLSFILKSSKKKRITDINGNNYVIN